MGADRRVLGAVGRASLEPSDLAFDFRGRLLAQSLLLDGLHVPLDVSVEVVALAKLVEDRALLLAQEVLALAAVHLAPGLSGDALLHAEQFDLPGQQVAHLPQPLDRRCRLQHELGFVRPQVEVAGRQVRQPARVIEIRGDHHDLGGDVLAQVDGRLETFLDAAHKGFRLEAVVRFAGLVHFLDTGSKEGLGLAQIAQAGPGETLDQDPHPAVGQLQHPHDLGGRADLVEVVLPGLLDRPVALGGEQDDAVAVQRVLDREHARVAADRKRQDDVGEDDRVLERQHRQDVGQQDRVRLLIDRVLGHGVTLPAPEALGDGLRMPGSVLARRLEQYPQLFHELVHVLELPVDGSETDVGHLVERLQAVDDEVAQLRGGDLPILLAVEQGFGLVDDLFQRRQADRPLFAGLEQAAEELLAVELLAAAVRLDDPVGDVLDLFVGSEPAAAAQALPPAPDRLPAADIPRVDHAVIVGAAEWTSHADPGTLPPGRMPLP